MSLKEDHRVEKALESLGQFVMSEINELDKLLEKFSERFKGREQNKKKLLQERS